MATQQYHTQYARYKARIETRLDGLIENTEPACIYQPITYVLRAGGKRVRAVLVLLACESVGGSSRSALPAACAIEILHNFTLVHDDVMDHSPLRRGRPTVHTKWDTNVAILSGDELVAYGYASLLETNVPTLPAMMKVFTNAFIEVCEGQGYDKEFETRRNVTVEEYLMMIRKKTARVISAACELGALAGNGTPGEVRALKTFGEALGMAFQLQDDFLDIAGTEQQLGKPIGGDVMEGKKTFLFLNAFERATSKDKKILDDVIHHRAKGKDIVPDVLRIYERTGALAETQRQVSLYTSKAQRALLRLKPGTARSMLHSLSEQLLERNS